MMGKIPCPLCHKPNSEAEIQAIFELLTRAEAETGRWGRNRVCALIDDIKSRLKALAEVEAPK